MAKLALKYRQAKHFGQYKPNLPDLMTLCATNYALMVRLLADKEIAGETRTFFVSNQLSYILNIKEVTRYTTLIEINQQALIIVKESTVKESMVNESVVNESVVNEKLGAVLNPRMQIRLYHDARMAEVISSQQVRQIKPRYDYPNKQMHQPDEKLQINIFLKEWLQLCLEQGQVEVNLDQ